MMERWTNGRYKATLHRVMNNVTTMNEGQERYSIPLFFEPNFDALIETLPTCLEEGEKPKFEPTFYGPYLRSRLDATWKYRQPKKEQP